jgi:hypothetical protein
MNGVVLPLCRRIFKKSRQSEVDIGRPHTITSGLIVSFSIFARASSLDVAVSMFSPPWISRHFFEMHKRLLSLSTQRTLICRFLFLFCILGLHAWLRLLIKI